MQAQNDAYWRQFNVRSEREGWPIVCDDALVFDVPRIGALLTLWRGVGRGLAMPRRASITVRVLGVHLPDVAILDVSEAKNGPQRYRFRLLGDVLVQHWGNVTGRYVGDTLPAPMSLAWPLAFEAVLKAKAPLRFAIARVATKLGPMKAEALIAPLAGDDGESCSLLMSVVHSPLPKPQTV